MKLTDTISIQTQNTASFTPQTKTVKQNSPNLQNIEHSLYTQKQPCPVTFGMTKIINDNEPYREDFNKFVQDIKEQNVEEIRKTLNEADPEKKKALFTMADTNKNYKFTALHYATSGYRQAAEIAETIIDAADDKTKQSMYRKKDFFCRTPLDRAMQGYVCLDKVIDKIIETSDEDTKKAIYGSALHHIIRNRVSGYKEAQMNIIDKLFATAGSEVQKQMVTATNYSSADIIPLGYALIHCPEEISEKIIDNSDLNAKKAMYLHEFKPGAGGYNVLDIAIKNNPKMAFKIIDTADCETRQIMYTKKSCSSFIKALISSPEITEKIIETANDDTKETIFSYRSQDKYTPLNFAFVHKKGTENTLFETYKTGKISADPQKNSQIFYQLVIDSIKNLKNNDKTNKIMSEFVEKLSSDSNITEAQKTKLKEATPPFVFDKR
jgi:hypothetical protein